MQLYSFSGDGALITLEQPDRPACACAGVSVRKIEVGQISAVDWAIRADNFSYRYMEPSRYIYTDTEVTGKQ